VASNGAQCVHVRLQINSSELLLPENNRAAAVSLRPSTGAGSLRKSCRNDVAFLIVSVETRSPERLTQVCAARTFGRTIRQTDSF
jgi:hypothetical protein